MMGGDGGDKSGRCHTGNITHRMIINPLKIHDYHQTINTTHVVGNDRLFCCVMKVYNKGQQHNSQFVCVSEKSISSVNL